MPNLTPLKQFICDTCGETIKAPNEGWMEWLVDSATKKAHSFRICHHVSFSPLEKPKDCYQHGGRPGRSDQHLHHILENRMAVLLSFIDQGTYHDAKYSGPHVNDLRELVEIMRRLTIPFYEEARLYWRTALEDNYFEGANEVNVYTEGFLMDLVDKYKE